MLANLFSHDQLKAVLELQKDLLYLVKDNWPREFLTMLVAGIDHPFH